MHAGQTPPTTNQTRTRVSLRLSRRRGRLVSCVTVAAVLLVAALIVGCGSAAQITASRTADVSSKSKTTRSVQAYARCMRAHGVTNFEATGNPHQSASTGGAGHKGPQPLSPKVKAAHKACEKYIPKQGSGA